MEISSPRALDRIQPDVSGAGQDWTMNQFNPRDAVRFVWAKALPYSGELEEWLPLWQHLDDCADVAGMLWDHWVAPSVRSRIARELPSEQHARALLVWLAGAHDLGKATPGFAIQSLDLAAELTGRGLHVSGMIRND